MQFDFTLAAGQSQTMDVAGRFFKYKSGTGVIRVRATGGGYVDLLPGQGVFSLNFTSLTITDKSGAANAGVLLAGEYDFRDDRIVGQVEVISGERTRTLTDKAFVAYVNGTGDLGAKPHMQLWNPANSGRNLIVEKIIFSSTTAQTVRINSYNVALNISSFIPQNKKLGSAGASVAQALQKVDGAAQLGTLIYNSSCLANTPQFIALTEPFLVPPGWGIMTVGNTAATDLPTNFEYYEEVI